jgi:ribosome-binding protein aMBF1 (putative translation factor)
LDQKKGVSVEEAVADNAVGRHPCGLRELDPVGTAAARSGAMKTKADRNRAIRTAVEEFGYRQKELADHLGMHYSTISRFLNEEISKRKT